MPRKPKSEHLAVPVSAHVHTKEKRANIPTRELQHFVKDEEKHPQSLLYPRKPELDPQLVWKGKDEQDARGLYVPTVPIYIQEKIAPQAIIENLQLESHKLSQGPSLFADFNGIEFDKLIDFYKHQQNWTNRIILGDSLLVMNSLSDKEGLKGRVQVIFMDPPYGIKFGSNWQVSTRKREVKDGRVEDATRQPEQIKAFRDTWQLGIHSYLGYLRDRLTVARDLLTESGSIFVQIGDENVHLVRCLLDEIFGRDNFCSLISFRKTSAVSSPMARVNVLGGVTDLILWYAKDFEHLKYRQLYLPKSVETDSAGVYSWVELQDGTRRRMTEDERSGASEPPEGARVYRVDNVTSAGYSETLSKPTEMDGLRYTPGDNRHWATTPDGMARLVLAGRLVPAGKSLGYVRYIDDFPVYPLVNNWTDTGTGSFTEDKIYVVQTGTKVVERCILMSSDPGDLILDPTCGSGTTAYVAEQWGRRWITVDTSRIAVSLARTRLMSAKYPYYLLADTPEGARKEMELAGRATGSSATDGDLRKGFVSKRVPHVTLKAIANNKDIVKGASRQRILTAISASADVELLVDQPVEDVKRVRVSGPFTVESLSPHRMLSDASVSDAGPSKATGDAAPGQFEMMILSNLKKAGIQNTLKKQRLAFERLDPFAGVYLHAAGEYSEGGQSKRVAICIGPEHGTVGPELVKDAAKEAVKGVGFDLVVVCGFAFDAHVGETSREFGKLTVLMARMNPDLTMGDELLKKTSAGNLFMVFGEPDLEVKRQKDGKLVVEIHGLDVYDPTTGQIRSHSTDDIAAWFIDTDYNEESFFVRHAYFCGADEPYEKLKKALRAVIDEEAWAALYSTKSRPFDSPKKGKIAVKVINHYGDEVLKVYPTK